MKNILLFIACVFIDFICDAQTQKNTLNLNDSIEVNLQNETAPQSLGDQFSFIKIIDARDDSSEIGYCYSEGGYYYNGYADKIKNKCYRIMPSVQQGITTWCTNYLRINKQDSTGNTLLVVIKRFWISSDAAPILLLNDKKGQPAEGFDAGVLTKMEFYLKKDSVFYPLYRFDSVLTISKRLPQYAGYYITEALKKSLDKLFNINWTNISRKKIKLSFVEIELENKKTTKVAILNDSAFKKGVYKNFEEFKMNSPSIAEYELREGKMGDVLYVKENAKEYPERNAWGYCNGTDLFINSADKYSKLIKRQNTFYFAGIKGIARKSKHDFFYTSFLNLATNTGRKHTSFSQTIKFYKVDMETGEVY